MPWTNLNKPDTKERIVSGLSYLTFGIAGLLYFIFGGKSSRSPFFNFHFRQSIVLWLLCLLMGMAASALSSILSGTIGLINGTASNLLVQPLGLAAYLLDKIVYLVSLYGAIWAFLGKYAEVPLVSNLVRKMR
jgi:uncharacterized membrane protein